MDYELIFWLSAVVVAPIIIIGTMAYRIHADDRARQWQRDHADDFNKDL